MARRSVFGRGAAADRRRPVASLPGLLRAAQIDRRRRGGARERAAGHGQRPACSCRERHAASGRRVHRRRAGRLPRGALSAIPRPPRPHADRACASVPARAGAARGPRLHGGDHRHARGRRPDALLRACRGGGRRRVAADDGRPRPVRSRQRPRGRARAAQGQRARGGGPGAGARALRNRAGAGDRPHRPARGSLRRHPRRPGDRRQDGGRAAARPRLVGGGSASRRAAFRRDLR